MSDGSGVVVPPGRMGRNLSDGILSFQQEAGLPRFFFHLILDHEVLLDEDGLEMGTLADARSEAEAIIRELVSEQVQTGRAFPFEFIRITNEEHAVLDEVSSERVLEKILFRKTSDCPV